VLESEFWDIVQSAGSPDRVDPVEQCEAITNTLSGSSKEHLLGFANLHLALLGQLYTLPILKACYAVIGYVSDDVFEDFRNWIILNGKERFEATVADPEVIASYAKVRDPVEEICGEPLLYVCENSWDGDVEDLEAEYVYPEAPNISLGEPSREEIASELPRLVERFNFGALGRNGDFES